MENNAKNILSKEKEQRNRLQQIVEQTISEEKLIVENLLNEPEEILTSGQGISDKVARFGGSWKFIIAFMIILFIWIVVNTATSDSIIFDPYPFILMNLILSTIAALQAPIIMMSQNRKEEKDRKRSENDYLINLKAELELRSLHQKMDLLLEEQIKVLFESQARQMDLLEKISKQIKTSGT
jgi:uncharacterized membrane protein